MTKTALLTASAVAAMALAGVAQAGTITGKVNGQAIAANEFYTIAKERTDAADQTADGAFIVTNTLTAKPSIATGAPAQTFQVTFDITGGTIPTSETATLTVNQTVPGGTTAGTTSVVQGARSASSITFIVTVNAPTGGGAATVDGFTLTTRAANSAAEANIAVASTTAVAAGGVTSTIDTTAARTLVRYQNILLSSLGATSNNTKAALPDFKKFTSTGVTAPVAPLSNSDLTAELGSDFKVAAALTGAAGGTYYGGLTGAGITAADIVDGGTLVITGNFPASLTPAVTAGGTLTKTASSASFFMNNAQVDTLIGGNSDFTLTQTGTAADQLAIPAGSYVASLTPTLITGYTSGSVGGANAGTIALDGTNFIAPWFSGSQAQTQSQVRLSNTGSSAATVRVSITNGVFNFNGQPTTFNDASCATGAFTLPVNGDLVLSNSVIFQCFGAFLRGDLLISVEAAGGGVTAKMRNTSASGTFETSLGRYSGGTATEAAQ